MLFCFVFSWAVILFAPFAAFGKIIYNNTTYNRIRHSNIQCVCRFYQNARRFQGNPYHRCPELILFLLYQLSFLFSLYLRIKIKVRSRSYARKTHNSVYCDINQLSIQSTTSVQKGSIHFYLMIKIYTFVNCNI